ncbi:FusB/FusC family EF-G-binding protein [Halobacillus mangrovi]|uniref:FusB/FusC family EF-G-binding protein n=1 Tax=Halobacillus mangrovi TaxID=402384 RepID=UPI003D968DF4
MIENDHFEIINEIDLSGGERMEAFIRSDQYNYIQDQTRNLVQGHTTTNDAAVTQALKSLTLEKVLECFDHLTENQKSLLQQVECIKDETEAIFFLSRIKQHIIPFPKLDEKEIKDLFPKVKKLKIPDINHINWNELSYLSWNDHGSNRKYLIHFKQGEYYSLRGSFTPSAQKGICTICNEYEHVGMFTATLKGGPSDNRVRRGNYICQDSQSCNQNLKSLKSLDSFIQLMKSQ